MMVTSHEMRTPLTVLKGYTDALIDEYLGPLSQGQRKSLVTCQRMINRMVTTFNDILEMLKINEGLVSLKLTTFDLSSVLRKILAEMETFIEKRHQTVVCNCPESLEVVADPEKIELVLINLIQNAIKFTYDEGTIEIKLMTESDLVHIAVRDSGIGIGVSEIERIFDKFYTTYDPTSHTSGRFEFSARGTGLGLSIARSYVESHGGRIWVESKGIGHGSCFHVLMPITPVIDTSADTNPVLEMKKSK
jgi:signal transduction histidine kinase